MPVSFIFIDAYPVTKQEEYKEHENYFLLSLWKYRRFTLDSVRTYDR